jgi:hypothetical protein
MAAAATVGSSATAHTRGMNDAENCTTTTFLGQDDRYCNR